MVMVKTDPRLYPLPVSGTPLNSEACSGGWSHFNPRNCIPDKFPEIARDAPGGSGPSRLWRPPKGDRDCPGCILTCVMPENPAFRLSQPWGLDREGVLTPSCLRIRKTEDALGG